MIFWPNAYLKHSLLIGLFSTGNQSNSYTDLYTVYMYVTDYGKSKTMVHDKFDKMNRFICSLFGHFVQEAN